MTVTSIRLFAHGDPLISVGCLLGSTVVAGVIGLLDHYGIVIPGLYEAGWAELARGGLTQSNRIGAIVKKVMVVFVRSTAAISIAQVTTFAFLVPIFGETIESKIRSEWQQTSLPIYSEATARVDAAINAANDAVGQQETTVKSETDFVSGAQQTVLNPVDAAPDVVAARSELANATDTLTRATDQLLTAKQWSADEIAGVKGAGADHSGVAGEGPVYKGAQAKVAAAADQVAAATQALAAARKRLAEAQSEATSDGSARADTARQQLPDLKTTLARDTGDLSILKGHLADLQKSRNDDIEAQAETSPQYQPRDEGLLNDMQALHDIADGKPIDGFVIGIVEAAALTIELGLVLARSFVSIPSRIASILARDIYLNAVARADEVDHAMRNGVDPEPPEGGGSGGGNSPLPPMDDGKNGPNHANGTDQPPRRRRGRPPRILVN